MTGCPKCEPCPTCEGTGDASVGQCTTCDGTKRRIVDAWPSAVNCTLCDNTGRVTEAVAAKHMLEVPPRQTADDALADLLPHTTAGGVVPTKPKVRYR